MVTTFLVCTDIRFSMRFLTNAHLGKQRVEGCQIVDALIRQTGWKNHPAARMWRGYEYALMYYVNCAIQEWINRGCYNTIPFYRLPEHIVFPWWVSWEKLHRSHRNLLRQKDPNHYNFLYDAEFSYLGYIWPSDEMYERREAPIHELALPLTERLLYARYCPGILRSGKRAGAVCGKLLQLHDAIFCAVHARS